MSMKWPTVIQFSICILKGRIPSIEEPPSVPISVWTSPTIGKNWQITNAIANPSKIVISLSAFVPRNKNMGLFNTKRIVLFRRIDLDKL